MILLDILIINDANHIDMLWDWTTILELLPSVANPNRLALRPNNSKLNIFSRQLNSNLSLIVIMWPNAYKETQTTVIPIVNLWPNVYKETQTKGIHVFERHKVKTLISSESSIKNHLNKQNLTLLKFLSIHDHKMLLQWVVGSICDEDMVSTRAWNTELVQVPIGPVTRARAKKFKESLNGLIQHIWAKDHLCGPNDNSTRDLQGVVSMIQDVE